MRRVEIQHHESPAGNLPRRPRRWTCALVSAVILFAAAGAAGDELRLLDAVALLLERDPNVARAEAALASSRGTLLAAAGRFEPVVTSRVFQLESETPLEAGGSFDSGVTQGEVGVRKQFRTGLAVESGLSLLRDDPAGLGGAVNEGGLSFTFRQPLLRDRGRRAVTAFETSAARSVEAVELDLQHTVSLRVLAVVDRYWRFRAAREELEILRESERLSEEFLANTRRLAAADLRPAADIVLLEANLAAKQAARIEGERKLFTARQDLGREIGLTYEEILQLGLPAEPFPRLPENQAVAPGAAERYIELARGARADLAAARFRLAASEALETAAENELRPQLDLVVTPAISGLAEGTEAERFFSPFSDGGSGFSTSVSLDVSWPPANRLARGQLLVSRARSRIEATEVELLALEIGAGVPSALETVASGAQRLALSELAVELFEQALINEERKLQAGRSTLIDVITQQDRLTSARQAEVAAAVELALALAQLRFETGLLIAGDGETPRVSRQTLLTLPPLEGPPE